MSANNIYYVYEWVRTDGTPYYIGKGKKKRAFDKRRSFYPGDDRVNLIKQNLTEQEAWDLEVELIAKYGRKDLGTGILRNKTDGGEGSGGMKHSDFTKAQISEIMKEVSAESEWRDNLSKKVRLTMNTPEFILEHSKRIKEGHAKSDKMEARGKHISETKQSKEWKETVWQDAFEKKMQTQKDPQRVAERRARNTKPCPHCGQMIYGKSNMKQHIDNKHGEGND
jgi:hypothetical protein